MSPKRLVLLVEGDGEVLAAPVLFKRLLNEYSAFDTVFLDPYPLRVGEYSKISKNNFGEWRRFLQVAIKRQDFGGCILLLDGDSNAKVEHLSFCAARAARVLATEAQKVGAGELFSTAIVFACMEFESWLIAGIESAAGKPFRDGRKELSRLIEPLPSNTDVAPRDAKGWLRKVMTTGYKPARDQFELTEAVDFDVVRSKNVRSFRRLESAVQEVVNAIRSGMHVVSPIC